MRRRYGLRWEGSCFKTLQMGSRVPRSRCYVVSGARAGAMRVDPAAPRSNARQ